MATSACTTVRLAEGAEAEAEVETRNGRISLRIVDSCLDSAMVFLTPEEAMALVRHLIEAVTDRPVVCKEC